MDLNYLFYRQQVERSRVDTAQSEVVRRVHAKLAIEYEKQIARATDNRPSKFPLRADPPAPISDVNATMAVAITAREVAAGK